MLDRKIILEEILTELDSTRHERGTFKNEAIRIILDLHARDRDHEINRNLLNKLTVDYAEKSLALEKANGEIQDKNRQMNELLGIAAHDLRNPIGINKMYAEFMLATMAESLSEQQLDMIRTIRKRADFMLQLLDDLLDLSKIEAGKIELKIESHDYLAFVAENVDNNRLLATDKDIRIVLETSESLAPLPFDLHKLDQVLNNLLGNAVKYSESGTQVSVSVVEREGSIVTSVADQGPGIPNDELHKLFQPFQRTSVRATGGEKSTGLGLAICKNIVEAHGGTITVESVPGTGTVFSYTLPMDCSDSHFEPCVS